MPVMSFHDVSAANLCAKRLTQRWVWLSLHAVCIVR